MEQEKSIMEMKDWKRNVIIIGIIVGAAVGFGAAYLFTHNSEDPGNRPQITPGDGLKLGLLVMGLLRAVADLGGQR